uniref:(northern house mosquito) hypothetical protein n=1 Tax=Culex pipiens TaxID=7175 RepID=A0A8D8PHC5_CULPI
MQVSSSLALSGRLTENISDSRNFFSRIKQMDAPGHSSIREKFAVSQSTDFMSVQTSRMWPDPGTSVHSTKCGNSLSSPFRALRHSLKVIILNCSSLNGARFALHITRRMLTANLDRAGRTTPSPVAKATALSALRSENSSASSIDLPQSTCWQKAFRNSEL